MFFEFDAFSPFVEHVVLRVDEGNSRSVSGIKVIDGVNSLPSLNLPAEKGSSSANVSSKEPGPLILLCNLFY